VGAGDGFLLKEFISEGKNTNLSAIEYNEESIQKLKELNIQVFSDISKIHKKSRYDLIILSHVLEHVLDQNTFLVKLNALLNKNGYIFVDVPCLDYLLKNDTGSHISFFDLFSLNYFFKKRNFDDVAAYYCGPNFFILRFTKSFKIYLFLMNMLYIFTYNFTKHKVSRLSFIWSLNSYSKFKRMWIRAIYRKL